MIKYRNCLYIFAVLLCLSTQMLPVHASDLNKAYKYLNTGDYANAGKFLREVIADDPTNVAGNFGLAKFYFLKDNSLYNIDSANTFIKRAVKKLPLNPKDKQTKKYLLLGVRDYTINALFQDINHAAYKIASDTNTVASYNFFIHNFTDSALLEKAVQKLHNRAYTIAVNEGTSAAIDSFIKAYPNADELPEAKALYQKLLYHEITADKAYTSYKKYMDEYPTGAFFKEAKEKYETGLLEYYNNRHDLEGYTEFVNTYKSHPAIKSIEDSIYTIVTRNGTIDEYRKFVNSYKNNHRVYDAWMNLYILSTADATDSAYTTFLAQYPDFPDNGRISADRALTKLDLRPFSLNDKYGYATQINHDSTIMVIPVEYDEASEFKDGLAWVRNQPCAETGCLYFYIDKENRRVFAHQQFNYAGDFENGIAIVGSGNCDADSCKYGMINKLGRWTVLPVYDELDDATEGLFEVSKDGMYGFINQQGNVVISIKYSNALPFSQGLAAVQPDTNWIFINSKGEQALKDSFRDVSGFKDSMCAVSYDGDTWGYIDLTGNIVIPPAYEDAGDFENGLAIVSKKEKDPKHKGLYISQRYKIDKTGTVKEKLLAPKPVNKKGKHKKGRSNASQTTFLIQHR